MRKKHTDVGSPRRIGQKQMSLEERNLKAFCGHPQISGSRISDPSADEKVQRPFFGLDCYELFRRNSMPVRLKTRPNLQELPRTQHERRPESWQHGMTVSPSIDRARLNLLRTSLSEDRPSQPSPDIWRTKPPRPPPLPSQGTESVPVGRVAEIVSRVENLLLQSEGNNRLSSGSRSAAVASSDRDRGPTRQQSAAHPTSVCAGGLGVLCFTSSEAAELEIWRGKNCAESSSLPENLLKYLGVKMNLIRRDIESHRGISFFRLPWIPVRISF
ncbi:hypothetical protein SprV_0200849600 [Sparganum proliferum]